MRNRNAVDERRHGAARDRILRLVGVIGISVGNAIVDRPLDIPAEDVIRRDVRERFAGALRRCFARMGQSE